MPALIITCIAIVLGLLIVAAVGRPVQECNHPAPDRSYTVDEAHHAMQAYRDCDHQTCEAKFVAFHTLVDAGKLIPVERTSR
ncbi:hypothetical protein AB0H76_15460 [Nocardia sp. NPDC050712]|uniref:hypothetical protein n=1 Tax=Nocardia sp. NPDC050712 TaxID=3155518 RepID=UPI0033CEB83F